MISAADQTYWTQDYWTFMESQCSMEEARAEIIHLRTVIEEQTSGRRVMEIGCGTGRRTLGLAQAGFQVTGLDSSAWAIAQARQRAARSGFAPCWEEVDLLSNDSWPLGTVDAAICVDGLGWGSDADQRRILRQARRYLVPNGALILMQTDAAWILRHAEDLARATVGEARYHFQQRYDPITGHSQGRLVVFLPDQTVRVHQYDRRLYWPVELAELVREAGYSIAKMYADVTLTDAPNGAPRRIQIIARPLPALPTSLAVASWGAPAAPCFDMRYAPDEAEWLDPAPTAIWEELIRAEAQHGADAVGHYPVDDPYGGERGAAVVARHFGCPVEPHQLTFGPGVTSLLHDLSGLADGGRIVAPQLTHPDLTAWATARGSEVFFVEEPATLDQLVDAITARRPTLVHLDRPNFAGELLSLDELQALGEAAARVGAAVLIDESPATYFGPAGSAAPLIGSLPNLVVLRGLTKAYSWGGMRVSYALASQNLSDRVRELVSPLQVGELAFRAVLRLLEAGDIFGRLRARIHQTKPVFLNLLQAQRMNAREGHPDLPWVVLPDEGGRLSRHLQRLGICGLRFVASPAVPAPGPQVLVLFSPLSDARMAALRTHLQGGHA